LIEEESLMMRTAERLKKITAVARHSR